MMRPTIQLMVADQSSRFDGEEDQWVVAKTDEEVSEPLEKQQTQGVSTAPPAAIYVIMRLGGGM